MAQDEYGLRAGYVILVKEDPAEERLHTQGLKEIP
jgi:hypothetical protein